MKGHDFFGVFPYINLQVFCLLIILYILIALKIRDRKKNIKTNEYLVALFVVCILATAADICWAFYENVTVDVEDWILYLIEEIYFSCCAFASYLWLVFQEKYSNGKLGNNTLLLVIIFIPCLINIYFSITASNNHFIYYINSNDGYVRGPYHLYSALCNIAYLVAASIIAIYKTKLSHDPLDRYVYRSFVFYPLPMVIFGILQTITGQSYNCIGLVVSFYILYVKIGTGYDRKELEAENNLIDDYDAVFIVNSEADTIRTLRMSDEYKQRNSHINKHESSYQKIMKSDIRKNIAENYRKEAEIEFDAKHIMERLKKQESYYYDYCIKTSSNLYEHYRAKFDRASNIGEGIFILGIKNVEEAYQAQIELSERKKEEERMLWIINNIANDFEYIEYIQINDDKKEDEATIYRYSEFISEKVPGYEQEKKVTKRYDLLIDSLINEKQRDFFYKITRRENVLKNLKNNPSYIVDFPYDLDGKTHYYQIKFTVADKDEKGRVKSIVMGLKNIDAEVTLRDDLLALKKTSDEQETFIKLLVDSYVSAYYIDLLNNSYTIYKEYGEDKAVALDNYENAMADYIEGKVLDKDRVMMREMTSISYMRRTLSNKKEYYAIYTETAKENTFFKMTVIRGADDNHAVLAFLDVTDEYLKEQRIQQELEKQVRIRTKQIADMNNGVLELLGDVIERRSKESGAHVRRVRDFSEILALRVMEDYPEYGLDDRKIRIIKVTSMLHDVGKIAIPDTVLLKPGKLTAEEYEIMKNHCYAGYEIMKKLEGCWEQDYLEFSYDICRYHHERWDGKGYPDGLIGNEIPIAAQIVSLADCFDALTSKRVYKQAYDPETAFTMITTGECGAFSEKMISTLFRCKDELIKARLLSKDE